MKISVLITTRNRAEILRQCLKSLVRQSRKPDEIVVVDNATSDNTKEIIKSFHSLKIKYFFEKNIGIAFGRNKGLKEAKGDIFAFIDDDCLATKNWLKEIEKTFKSDKNIVGIVGRNENIFPKNSYAAAEQCWFLYWYLKQISSRNKEEILKDGEIIDFKNSAFRSSFFGKIKFNTDLMTGKFSEEDTEIRVRLFRKLKLKEQIIYQPKAMVYHRNKPTFLELFPRRFYKGIAFAELRERRKRVVIDRFGHRHLSSRWVKNIVQEIKQLDNFYDKILCVICIPLLPFFSKIGTFAYRISRLFGFSIKVPS